MKNITQPRFLWLASLTVLIYFVLMSYLAVVHEPDQAWIGALRELTVLPMMLLLLVLMVSTLYSMWINRRTFDLRLMGSVLVQAISVFVMQNASVIFG